MKARVSVAPGALEQMRKHAASTYPQECCGFLIGRDDAGGRRISRAQSASNQVDAERERRYVIPPEELRRLERELDGTDDRVLGFYHSHPDHPARPSEFDRSHAWPWYTYIILSTSSRGSAGVGAFELDPDSLSFSEVLLATEGRVPAMVSYGGVSESS